MFSRKDVRSLRFSVVIRLGLASLPLPRGFMAVGIHTQIWSGVPEEASPPSAPSVFPGPSSLGPLPSGGRAGSGTAGVSRSLAPRTVHFRAVSPATVPKHVHLRLPPWPLSTCTWEAFIFPRRNQIFVLLSSLQLALKVCKLGTTS